MTQESRKDIQRNVDFWMDEATRLFIAVLWVAVQTEDPRKIQRADAQYKLAVHRLKREYAKLNPL